MPKLKNAYVLIGCTIGSASVIAGAVLRDMPANQFDDLEAIDFVREATAEEVEASLAPIAPALLDPPAEHDVPTAEEHDAAPAAAEPAPPADDVAHDAPAA